MTRPARIFAAFLVTCGFAHAQEFAKARLEKSPRHLEYVKVKAGDREVTCYVGYPEVKDKAPAVIVIHEIFGLADWPKSVVDQFAEAGYIAIAPDLLSGMAPGGGGTDKLGSDAVRQAVMTLPPDQIRADLDAVAAYVTGLPSCNGKLAVAGFCWGGGQALRYAANNPKVLVSFPFYGSTELTEADAARIECPIYGFYGGNDNRVNATIPKTEALLKKAGKKYEPVIYDGAGHGFLRAGEDPAGTEPNKKAREAAWKRVKEILKDL